MTTGNSLTMLSLFLCLLLKVAVCISFTKQLYMYSDLGDDAPFHVESSPHYFGIIREDELPPCSNLINGSLQISLLPKFREVSYQGTLLAHGYVSLFRNDENKMRVKNLLASGDIIMAVVPIHDDDPLFYHFAAIETFGKKLVAKQKSISGHDEFQQAAMDLTLPFAYFLLMLTVGDDPMLIKTQYPIKMIHSVNHKDASIFGIPKGYVKVKSSIPGRHKPLSISYGYNFVYTARGIENVHILRLADGGVHVEAGPRNISLICPLCNNEVWVVLIRIHQALSGKQVVTLKNLVNFLDRRNPLQALSRIAESPLSDILSAYALPVNEKIGHSPAYFTRFVEAATVVVARDDPETYFYPSSEDEEYGEDEELEISEQALLSDVNTTDPIPSSQNNGDEATGKDRII